MSLSKSNLSLSEIRRQLDGKSMHTLSLDIFDTLLLRQLVPEHLRFLHMAQAIRRRLLDHGQERSVREVFHARLHAAMLDYRVAPITDGQREGRHDRIVSLQLHALDLPDKLSPLFVTIEIEYEIGAVSPNRTIVELAAHAKRRNKRVILVSDMYLRTPTINAILHAHDLHHLADAVYVSADVGMTKHQGGMFRHIAAKEGLPANGYIHVGDNRAADFLTATRAGWFAAWHPRPLLWRALNHGWNNILRLYASVS